MEDKKLICFLDIDGVLAGYEYLKSGKGFIDRECVKKLNRLEEFGTEIVVSSSWGYDKGRSEKALRDCGLTLPIIGYTEHFHSDWACRGNEIEKWLIDNMKGMGTKFGGKWKDKKYNYVILDDDMDMLLGQKDNFVQVDRETGLTDEDIEKCRKIFLEN